ncbi:MAG: hypothetical protein B6U72_00070 [Candidatus Altiarchaeales archaeon ex4484_2]|nr:MAG: hypothetical protein B6U72_00070 [Candidatus Altiarchaeales archaeon ex4484_2]
MKEDFTSILLDGFATWRNNPWICVPFILDFLAVIVFSILYFIAVILVLGILGFGVFSLFSSGQPEGMQNLAPHLMGGLVIALIIVLALVLVYYIITILITSFFTAGAIGMSKEAIEKNKTSVSTMIDYGRRKMMSLFAVNVIISLVYLLAVVIIVGVFIGVPIMLGFSLGGDGLMGFLFILPGLLLLILCLIVLSIVFAPVQYALVLSDLRTIDGLKRGVSFFLENKLFVFLLWLIISMISIFVEVLNLIYRFAVEQLPTILSLIMSFTGLLIYLVVLLVVVTPLFTVWWSRLYLARTGTGDSIY